MDPAVCLMYDFHQIIDQAFKNIQFMSQSHIVHSLGIVRSQSGAHTTGQKDRCYLALSDRFDTGCGKFLPVCLDFV